MDYNKRKFDGGHFKWPFNDKRVKFLHNFIQPQLLLQVYGHHPDDERRLVKQKPQPENVQQQYWSGIVLAINSVRDNKSSACLPSYCRRAAIRKWGHLLGPFQEEEEEEK